MLKIKNITFSYGKNDIFKNTDFYAKKGNITVIKGESGVGKSTLLDIISLRYGIIGDYSYNDKKINNSFKNNISYIQQRSILPENLKIIDQWKLLIKLYNKDFQLDNYIERLQINNICNLYPQQISGGERQRVLLINALIINKPILLLDEPTASINEDLKIELVNILEENKKDRIIIVSTHDDCFNSADNIYRIQDNHLTTNCLLKDENILYSYESHYDKNIRWLSYFIKMKEHHWFKNILSYFLLCLFISTFIYILFMNNTYIKNYTQSLLGVKSNDFIVYKALDNNVPYCEFQNSLSSNFPFTQNELDQIKEINYIKNIIPKYIISTCLYEDENPKNLIINKNGKEVYNRNVNGRIFFESYDFSKKYDEIKYFSNQKSGIYLHKSLMENIGLTEETIKGSMLNTNVLIPIYDCSGGNFITYEGSLKVPANGYEMKTVEINLPILGFIENNLPNTYSSTTQQILITYDIIEKIIKENKATDSYTTYYDNDKNQYTTIKEDAEIIVDYTPFEPNVYTITADSVDHVTEVASKLKDMGFTVQSDYFEYETLGNSIIQTKESLQLWSSITAIIILVLLCIKQFFRNGSEKNFNQWLNIIGINDSKELLVLKLKKYILDFCISLVLCVCILVIMIYFTLDLTGNTYDFNIMMIFVMIMIILFIYVGIPMIWEVTYDRN